MSRFDDALWAAVVSHEDTVLDPPTTTDAIATFESRHDVRLPSDHRKFLLRANGGIVGHVRLFGVNRSDALDLDLKISEMREWIEGMSNGPVLPIASDWGGNYFCYNLRANNTACEFPILCWNHEYSEEPDCKPLLWSNFAPNFVEFVRKVIVR